MCGIVGWHASSLAEGPPPDVDLLRRATSLLAARGPDGEGTWISPDGTCGLGHRRLAILDAEGGAQPMSTPDGRHHVVFNGEIFNHAELRRELEGAGETFATRSDTEVLLRLVARRGTAAVSQLRGQFAFAAYDASEHLLVLARDALGEKPLFTARRAGRLYFASTLPALLLISGVDREPDGEAISLFLSFSYIPSPWTAYRHARKLPAGHIMAAGRHGAWSPEMWWFPPAPRTFAGTFDDAAEALRETLRGATRRRLLADVPVGAFLSGGLDSAAVVAAARAVAEGVRTFTVRHPDPRLDESAAAAAVAAALGVSHEVLDGEPPGPEDLRRVLAWYGEPFGDSSAAVTAAVAAAARRRVTVALTGDGGDEVLGGYHRHAYLALVDRMPAGVPRWVRGGAPGRLRRALELAAMPEARRYYEMYECFPGGRRDRLLLPGFRRAHGETPREWLEALYLGCGGDDPVDRMLRTDLRTHLPDFMNVKVDVATMSHGLEARSPFQERDVVELCLSFPSSFKVSGFRGKRVLRRALERDLPRGLIAGRKRGFAAPVDEALLGPLRAEAERLLAPGGPLLRLDAVVPGEPLRLLEEHRRGVGNHRIRLWVLLALAAWAEREERP